MSFHVSVTSLLNCIYILEGTPFYSTGIRKIPVFAVTGRLPSGLTPGGSEGETPRSQFSPHLPYFAGDSVLRRLRSKKHFDDGLPSDGPPLKRSFCPGGFCHFRALRRSAGLLKGLLQNIPINPRVTV